MRLLFLYTVPHTGTRFLENLFHSNLQAYRSATISFTDHFLNSGVPDLDARYRPLTYSSLSSKVRSFAVQEGNPQYLGNAVNVIRHHRTVCDSQLNSSLTSSEIPVISTCRDPLLSINAHVWRAYANGWDTSWRTWDYETRVNTARLWLGLFHNLLDGGISDRFLFPIDLPELGNEAPRIRLVNQLMQYCDLPMTSAGVEYVREWQPYGELSSSPQVVRNKKQDESRRAKYAILNKNRRLVSALLPVIFKMFQQDESLKEKLYDIGYRDLVWW